ncbi:MAG: YihY/virulence factor BrkB family protein, partial [Bacteroidota bacterium]
MRFRLPNIQQLREQLVNLPILKEIRQWTQTHSLPGFFKVPIYDVATFIVNELRHHDLTTRANSIAFSFFLSLFPAMIALFTLLPYFQDVIVPFFPQGSSFQEELRQQILEILPGNAGNSLSEFIIDIVDNPRVGLTSVGFVLAIFFSSNGMIAMMRSFQKSYSTTFKKRNALQKRLVAIRLVSIIALMVVGSVLLVILGNIFINWLSNYIRADVFT